MANLQFTADLINDVLLRAREPSTSSFAAQVLVYLNRAYQELCLGGGEFVPTSQMDWFWLRKSSPGILMLQPLINTGTVAVTNNSSVITFSVAPSVSVAGRFFKVDAYDDVFRIQAHTAASTAADLQSVTGEVYTGSTNTAATYKVMALEYTLATDVLRVIGGFRTGRMPQYYRESPQIPLGGLEAMENEWPLRRTQGGVPARAGWVTETKVRFSHYGGETSTDQIRLEYDYLQIPTLLTSPGTTEEPLVPRRYRYVLAEMALYWLWTDKNDKRREMAKEAATNGIAAMVYEYNYKAFISNPHYARVFPRPVRRRRRHFYRTPSGQLVE